MKDLEITLNKVDKTEKDLIFLILKCMIFKTFTGREKRNNNIFTRKSCKFVQGAENVGANKEQNSKNIAKKQI